MKHRSLKVKQLIINQVLFVIMLQPFVFPLYGYDNQKSEDKDAITLSNTLTERNQKVQVQRFPGLRIIKPERPWIKK